MHEYDISDFLDPRFQYRVKNVLRQRWQRSGYDYRRIPRPECGLLLVTQGSIEFCGEEGHLQADAGDLIFLPKGCHYEAVTVAARDYLINFYTDAEKMPSGPVRLLSGVPVRYVDTFAELVELKLRGQQDSFAVSGRFQLLLEQIVGDWKNTALFQKNNILETALPLLAEDALTISQVAERCGISESGFRARFRKAMGVSPLQYRLNGKIARAGYLLESTDFSVQQIAEMLGFYDEAYFCKLFRQKVGCSPREYAKNQQL